MIERKDRPVKGASRADRPRKRVRVSGHRDILTVENKNPDYHYRWVLDTTESGARIRRYLEGGYEFVTKENDGVTVAEDNVRNTEDLGTLFRVPAGPNSPDMYLYLMRIPREWREEDTDAEEKELRAREARVFRKDTSAGQYVDVDRRSYGPDPTDV